MTDLSVAVCFGTYPPERNGGADFIARFASALADEGCSVHVLTSVAQAPEVEQVSERVTVHRIVQDWAWPGGRDSLRRINATLDRVDARVVHVFFPDSVIEGAYQLPPLIGLGRRPLVTTFWNLGLGRRSPLPVRLASVGLILRSKVISSHDPTYLAALRRLVAGTKPVEFLPVGSNFGGAVRTRTTGPFTLGFFGQLDFTRGVDTLFEALARLARPEVRLVMLGSAGRPERYGDDPEFARLLALPAQLGIAGQVEWTGFLDDAEVSQRLADLDLCVLPYRRNSIGRSALAAALAVGVPVVLGGRADRVAPLVPGRDVALVPPDDPDVLATELGRLIDDPEARTRLGAGAAHAARQFAWPRIAARALETYREALR